VTPAQAARARETTPSPTPQEHLAALQPLIAALHPKEEGAVVDAAPVAAQVKALFDEMHAADIAYVLESLPLEDRLWAWSLVGPEREG